MQLFHKLAVSISIFDDHVRTTSNMLIQHDLWPFPEELRSIDLFWLDFGIILCLQSPQSWLLTFFEFLHCLQIIRNFWMEAELNPVS